MKKPVLKIQYDSPVILTFALLGLLALLANQSGALQSVLQQLVGYGNSQALALAGYDLLANAVMAFMACAATVLTLLSTAFVRPRLHARRRRK